MGAKSLQLNLREVRANRVWYLANEPTVKLDDALLEGQVAKAGLMADTCLHRTRALNSPVEKLAVLRMIAYRGYLFSAQLELQVADLEPEPGSTDWLSEEYYFQLSRLHFARGEYKKALAERIKLRTIIVFFPYLSARKPLGTIIIVDTRPEAVRIKPTSITVAPRL